MKSEKCIKIFVIEVVLFWVLWFLFGVAYLNFYENLSEFLRIVTFIGLIIVAITALYCFVIILFKHSENVKFLPVLIFIIFLLIHLGMFYNFREMGNTTGGIFNIVDKEEIDGEYFFYVTQSDNTGVVKIECDKDIFEELIINEKVLYSFTYRWLSYQEDVGVLETNIDLENIIDNR